MTELEKSLHEFMLKYPKIPTHTLAGLLKYWVQREPAGDFLTAVLCNNLMVAILAATDDILAAIHDICTFVHIELPYCCYGSVEKVEKWLCADT